MEGKHEREEGFEERGEAGNQGLMKEGITA